MPIHVLSATVDHERNDQDVHDTSEWPLLPPKLALQLTEAVFVNKEPVNKVTPMTMTMTLREVQHLSMKAWSYRRECRGHDHAKKESVALLRFALLARCALTHC